MGNAVVVLEDVVQSKHVGLVYNCRKLTKSSMHILVLAPCNNLLVVSSNEFNLCQAMSSKKTVIHCKVLIVTCSEIMVFFCFLGGDTLVVFSLLVVHTFWIGSSGLNACILHYPLKRLPGMPMPQPLKDFLVSSIEMLSQPCTIQAVTTVYHVPSGSSL